MTNHTTSAKEEGGESAAELPPQACGGWSMLEAHAAVQA
jgi:hypothetical protein